jgi:hypothetical protein
LDEVAATGGLALQHKSWKSQMFIANARWNGKKTRGGCRSRSGPIVASEKRGSEPSSNHEEKAMRVMVIVKATKSSEEGTTPPEKLQQMFTEMGNYNEELVKAGIMLAGEGLLPSSTGKRIKFSGSKRTVVDGPFAEAKELIAGYWLWKVDSMEQAVEWASRCPNPMPEEESELEIRVIGEMEDFGAELTPEARAQEERLRAELEKKNK